MTNNNIPIPTTAFEGGVLFLLVGITFTFFGSEIVTFLSLPRSPASMSFLTDTGHTTMVLGALTLAGAVLYTLYLVGANQ